MEINRSDPIYLEIEKFESFELTNNAAFEMAARNGEMLEEINRALKRHKGGSLTRIRIAGLVYPYTGLHSQKSLDLTNEQREILRQIEMNLDPFPFLKYKQRDPRATSIVQGENVKFSSHGTGSMKNICLRTDVTDAEINKFLDEKVGTIFIDKSARKKVTVEEFKNSIAMAIKPEWLIRLLERSDSYEIIDAKSSFSPQNLGHSSKAKIEAVICTKRPLMVVEDTSKIVHTSFNMALSVKELKAQVEAIKIAFDANANRIKSTAEHFNIELKKANSLNSILTKSMKIANILYVYDCLKSDMGISRIATLINERLFDLTNKTTNMDAKTVKKYAKLGIKYIDHMGYKELLSGVKNL